MVENEVVATPSNEAEQTAPTNEVPQVPQTPEPAKPVETVQKAEVEAKEKVFTQAQLDEIVIARLSKEKSRMLKKLGVLDEKDIDAILEKSSNYDAVLEEAQALKIEKEQRIYKDALSELEIDKDFVEYALQKIDRGESLDQFKENAKTFLEANPKFRADNFKEVKTSLDLGGQDARPDFTKMTTEQYLRWREKNKL